MSDIVDTVEYAIEQGHTGAVFMFAPKLVAELKAARADVERLQGIIAGATEFHPAGDCGGDCGGCLEGNEVDA